MKIGFQAALSIKNTTEKHKLLLLNKQFIFSSKKYIVDIIWRNKT